MPIYPLKNTETGEIFEKIMKVAEYVEYVKDNPHIQRYYDSENSKTSVGDPTRLMDGIKPPSDFMKGIIGRMQASIPGNTLHDRKYTIPREW